MIRAPEIDRPDVEWLNTDRPLSLATLRGRLVLLDFWTFCCVNCLHTIPVLRRLKQKFDEAMVVIGIHSPKFTHEHDIDQVRQALRRYDIRHPVVHDTNRRLWDEYAIRAWPTIVQISADGHVVGQYPGEPQEAALEALIRQSLDESPAEQGGLQIVTTPAGEDRQPDSAFDFPGKIKRCPGEKPTWVLADTGNHQVVQLDENGLEIRRFGSGCRGFEDGSAATASLNGPEGLGCSENGVYVADTRNHAIRHIDLASGDISTLAGTGERGMPLMNYWSSGEHLALASPWDIELVGERLYFANAGTHQIAELRLSNGGVRAAAGSGREGIHDGPAAHAQLAQPSGLSYDPMSQLLYFVDSETSSVRSLDLRHRWVETLVGHGLFVFGDAGGLFSEARMQHPLGIAVCDGTLYVADTYNNAVKVLDPQRQQVGRLDDQQYVCTDALCIPLSEPAGLSCAPGRRLLVVDTNNHRIMEFDLANRRSVTWSPPLSQSGIDRHVGVGE